MSSTGEPVGLVRERLVTRVLDPARFTVGTVIAPAGSGKSWLLGQIARLYAGPVAWCGSPDPVPRSEAAFVGWVASGLARWAGDDGDAVPLTVDDLLRWVDPPPAGLPILLLLDDVHLLEDSDAEGTLADLVSRCPPWLRVVMAGRVGLALDLSRLRVTGKLVEIGHDDLRFRTWEIEELFRDVYDDPLVPEDVGTLARRTGGWAAYLQLFHLATAKKPQGQRRQVLANLSSQARYVHEYLSRHVLSGLSDELRAFLVRTSVLRRPTPELCDTLLGTCGGSAEMLAELERKQLFTERVEDGSYRYHTVLLSYLDALLVETIGIEAARAEHRKAAEMLETVGYSEDALAAYAKAQDWAGVARVLGRSKLEGISDAWLEALPPAVVETDSLLLAARARISLLRGSIDDAVRTLRSAEAVAASAMVAARCRSERESLVLWSSAERVALGPTDDWAVLLRAATQQAPGVVARQATGMAGVAGRFAHGLATFLSGDMTVSSQVLMGVASSPDASGWMAAAARLAGSIALAISASPSASPDGMKRALDEIDAVGVPWLARLGRVMMSLGDQSERDVTYEIIESCERDRDLWGAGLASLFGGAASMVRRTPRPGLLEQSVRIFDALGAGSLSAIAYGYLSLVSVMAGATGNAELAARRARSLGSSLSVPCAEGIAALAMGLLRKDDSELEKARSVLEPLGMWAWHAAAAGLSPAPLELAAAEPSRAGRERRYEGASTEPLVRIRCFGEFEMSVAGVPVDELAVKPMERTLLHMLAFRAGDRVHREEIVEALWPDAEPDAGRHRLQVAISSLRRLLDRGEVSAQMIIRDGDAYRLSVPEGADVDVSRVDRALKMAAYAHSTGDADGEAVSIQQALDACRGLLLAADGPAEWVIGPRDRFRTALADAAVRLAHIRMGRGDPAAAAEAARTGLAFDRYRDELWQALVDAAELAGHHAQAAKARQGYAEVLEELGVRSSPE